MTITYIHTYICINHIASHNFFIHYQPGTSLHNMSLKIAGTLRVPTIIFIVFANEFRNVLMVYFHDNNNTIKYF